MKRLTLSVFCLVFALFASAQQTEYENKEKEKSPKVKKKRVAKEGWSFGGLPAVAYDSDQGFLYGALANIYHFGDGSRYPNYDHSIYIEWSRTTKGSGINQLVYDSDRLIPNTRITSEVSYLTEKALDFYGFNGYQANYNPNFEDKDSEEYISRVFYRLDRRMFRLKSDFQINLVGNKLRALVGYTYLYNRIDSVDVPNINDGANDDKKVPVGIGSLYQDYYEAGIIDEKYKNGGKNNLFKLGLVYDTRDALSNPNKGMWAEAFLLTDPGFTDTGYGKLIFNWHHYVSIVPQRVNLAYRVSMQSKLWGDIPWYMLPFSFNSSKDRDGLGGGKTLRGILRNRVVGDGIAFTNIELRTVLYRTVIANQNFFIGVVPFVDMGMVIQETDVDYSLLPTRLNNAGNFIQTQNSPIEEEKLHMSYGGELKFVLNDNFVVSVSYGRSAAKDGESGLYIGLNYLF